jgi:hypothetical protein
LAFFWARIDAHISRGRRSVLDPKPQLVQSGRQCHLTVGIKARNDCLMMIAETTAKDAGKEAGQDFIRDIVRADLESGRREIENPARALV